MEAVITGWAHTRFGKLDAPDIETLVAQVTRDALRHADVGGEAIDGVFVGLFNNGFSKQDFPSSLPFEAEPSLRFKPSVRVENACATGSAAVYAALDFIASGRGRSALVVGVEKMTSTPAAQVGLNLLGASHFRTESHGIGSFAEVFGRVADAYFARWGDRSDALARIAAKNHRNGVANPYAQIRRDLGFAFCRTVSPDNPRVAGPLRRTDCSPISDGAAALVLRRIDDASDSALAIGVRARAQVNDFLPSARRDMTRLEGAARAWHQVLERAGMSIETLDLVETHDCFTIAELMQYEAMGLVPLGQGHVAVDEGWTQKDGRLPVNPSGGLKAKGHPIGATGVSMHVLAAMQLAGAAGDMQVPSAAVAGVFNMGGLGVANYATILERVR